jgi:hypothetical protein
MPNVFVGHDLLNRKETLVALKRTNLDKLGIKTSRKENRRNSGLSQPLTGIIQASFTTILEFCGIHKTCRAQTASLSITIISRVAAAWYMVRCASTGTRVVRICIAAALLASGAIHSVAIVPRITSTGCSIMCAPSNAIISGSRESGILMTQTTRGAFTLSCHHQRKVTYRKNMDQDSSEIKYLPILEKYPSRQIKHKEPFPK